MVTIAEEQLPSGWRALRLENEAMRLVLLPDKGSEIYELRAKSHDLDLLWKSPWGLRRPGVAAPTATSSTTAWLDDYIGGWQELFPNGGDPCAYRGAELGFHGEASVRPWDFEIGTREDGEPEIRLAIRLSRLPFTIEKRVSLEPDRPVLCIRERIANEGSDAMPYMWGHHPAYGAPFLGEGCQLDVPATTFEADEIQSSTSTWLTPGQRSAWPNVPRENGEAIDLSRVPGPEAGVANLGYALGLREGWYALSNPKLGLGIGLVWPVEVFSCLWIWQELRGTRDHPWFGRCYVMGVEPHSSYPGRGLETALALGTARWLGPGAELTAELRAVLFEPRARVQRVRPDGEVEFSA